MFKDTFKIYLFSLIIAVLSGLMFSYIFTHNAYRSVGAAVTPPVNVMQSSDPVTPISNLATLNTSVATLFDVGGTATFNGTVVHNGASTFGSSLTLNGTTSTLTILGATDKLGCIKMGDSRGSAYVPTYLTIASTTITATTTKPAVCQ